MGDKTTKRFYWLKLKSDFFNRHDIKIVGSMPNGSDYILFYLKLLCEGTAHEGELRLSDSIPYTEEMLSTLTNFDINIVRKAIDTFQNLGLLERLEDGTYFLREVLSMTGSAVDNDNANRQRRYRESHKDNALYDCYENVTRSVTKNNEILEIDLDKELLLKVERVINFWNQKCTNLVPAKSLTEKRKRNIINCIKTFGIDSLCKALSFANSDPFYTGDNKNRQPFDIDYFIRNPDVISRLIERSEMNEEEDFSGGLHLYD